MTISYEDARWNSGRPDTLIFDVNETLIDFESMNGMFNEIFGDKRVLREWLGHLIMYSMTITLSGLYTDYFTLGKGLLQMVGDIHGKSISERQIEALAEGMKTMPAHGDVAEALKALKEAGFRLVTLTNSPPSTNRETPLEHAGIAHFFERQFSIETARAYKPASVVYHLVAHDLGVPPARCCLVAAHVWDTIGAQSVGMSAALVTRPGNAPLPVPGLPQPNVVAPTLPELASRMIAAWRPK